MGQQARLDEIRGIDDGVSDREILDTFRQYMGEYGAALVAWPAIREAAQAVSGQLINDGALVP